jgi:UDP-N-acetylenolpyruvoylglucosamine reductase
LDLIAKVRGRALEKRGIELELELQIIGEELAIHE